LEEVVIAFFSAPLSAHPNPCAKRISMHPAAYAPVCLGARRMLDQTFSDYQQFALPLPLSAIESVFARSGRTTIN